MSVQGKAWLEQMGFSCVPTSPQLLSAETLTALLRPGVLGEVQGVLRASWDWWALSWGTPLHYLVYPKNHAHPAQGELHPCQK